MAVRELDVRPDAYAHFTDGRYRWLELHDQGGIYAHVAFAELDDDLELHISITQWGTKTLRHLKGDFEWLKGEARRLGKGRILGIRADDKGEFDPRLFRFARMFGFTDMHVYQTVGMEV